MNIVVVVTAVDAATAAASVATLSLWARRISIQLNRKISIYMYIYTYIIEICWNRMSGTKSINEQDR